MSAGEIGSAAKERIEAVRRALDGIGRRDLRAILDRVDPDVELHPTHSVWPQTYRGHAGVEEWGRDVAELWDEFVVHADGFRDLGGSSLLVRLRWRGRAKGATSAVAGPAAASIQFRGEKAMSIDVHLHERHALEALTSRTGESLDELEAAIRSGSGILDASP